MDGKQRREEIMRLMKGSRAPLSGAALAQKFGVSRQVIVQDIALLRAADYRIISTYKGYLCEEPDQAERVFYVNHSREQIQEELNVIVDYGGTVTDVFVEHEPYGELRAPLHVENRSQVQDFVDEISRGTSGPLLTTTSGYHYHTVKAESEKVLDRIEEELRIRHFLAENRKA